MNVNTVAVTDYRLLNKNLAKVVVAWTGHQTKDTLHAQLTEQMRYLATPVENSFRVIRPQVGVGFVRASTEVRVVDTNEIRAGYRVMASNILMDNKDKTLWEVRDGAAGKYLARHGNEDLSELIECTANVRRTDVPKLSALTIAKAAPSELVAFCTPDGDMDYGFVTRTANDKCQVVAKSTLNLKTVPYSLVASIAPVEIDRSVHKMVVSKMTAEDKRNAAEYWRTLFSYAPDYAERMVQFVNDSAAI